MDEAKTAARAARREEWGRVLDELAASGLTAARFCRERGVPAWKLAYWRKALRGDAPPAQAGGGFVELSAREPCGAAGVWVEAGRWRVRAEPGFDAATLRRAAEALSAP